MFKSITLASIYDAQRNLSSIIKHTPLLETSTLSDKFNANIYLKMENLQLTGSFKIRGAYNKVVNLTPEEKKNGIVASSAGNHAQGVAYAAREYGIKATICMPTTAPLSKVEVTKAYGAQVLLAGEFYNEAYEKALELEKNDGLAFCHPFNDPHVISGQGTIALEILTDAPNIDVIVAPIGGGGLISGIAIAAKSINPKIRIIGVQTDNMPSMKKSIENEELTRVDSNQSIADGIAVNIPGNLTYEIVRQYVDEVVTVSEAEIAYGILYLLEKLKTTAEGAGACPCAALLAGKIKNIEGKNVALLVSGGNIDVNKLGHIINNGLVQSWRKVYIDIMVPDHPHVLSKLATIISDAKANILSIHHDRTQRDLVVGDVHTAFELETMNEEHVKNLIDTLKKHGYPVVIK